MKDGHCAVIGLQTTGEASMEKMQSKSSSSFNSFFEKPQRSGLISLCKQIVVDFVTIHFPTTVQEKAQVHYVHAESKALEVYIRKQYWISLINTLLGPHLCRAQWC